MSIFHQIIKYPSITERNTNLRTNNNCYVFEVARDATKPMIKKAVEQIFSVKVEKVNTLNVSGKFKRTGKSGGYRPDWKKAFVTVQKGQIINKFSGA